MRNKSSKKFYKKRAVLCNIYDRNARFYYSPKCNGSLSSNVSKEYPFACNSSMISGNKSAVSRLLAESCIKMTGEEYSNIFGKILLWIEWAVTVPTESSALTFQS